MSYELFSEGPEVYIPVLLFSLIITVLAYCAFPLIFAKTRNKPITKKKYRGICYGINAAVMFVFAIINGGASNGAPYALWTTIFANLGVKILISRGIITDVDLSRKVEDGYYRASDFTTQRVAQCKSCGYRDKNSFDACPVCGEKEKEYFFVKERIKDTNTNPDIGALTEKINFCRKCGEKLIDNSKFCRKCGTEIITED